MPSPLHRHFLRALGFWILLLSPACEGEIGLTAAERAGEPPVIIDDRVIFGGNESESRRLLGL